jgi:hypothetical protein
MKEIMMGWTCSSDGEYKSAYRNFSGETSGITEDTMEG